MVLFFALYLVVAIIDELFLSATLNLRNFPLGHYLPLGFVDPEVGLLVLLYRPVMALPTLAVTVRRLHDVGKSGVVVCFVGIPCAGARLVLLGPAVKQAIPRLGLVRAR